MHVVHFRVGRVERKTEPAAQVWSGGDMVTYSSEGSEHRGLVVLLGGEQLQRKGILNEGGNIMARRESQGVGNSGLHLGPKFLRCR